MVGSSGAGKLVAVFDPEIKQILEFLVGHFLVTICLQLIVTDLVGLFHGALYVGCDGVNYSWYGIPCQLCGLWRSEMRKGTEVPCGVVSDYPKLG